MWIPFILFWVLILLFREELGVKGLLISIIIWAGLLIGCATFKISPYLFVSAQAIYDIVLLIMLVGGNVRIR
jgi:hypothetical protein